MADLEDNSPSDAIHETESAAEVDAFVQKNMGQGLASENGDHIENLESAENDNSNSEQVEDFADKGSIHENGLESLSSNEEQNATQSINNLITDQDNTENTESGGGPADMTQEEVGNFTNHRSTNPDPQPENVTDPSEQPENEANQPEKPENETNQSEQLENETNQSEQPENESNQSKNHENEVNDLQLENVADQSGQLEEDDTCESLDTDNVANDVVDSATVGENTASSVADENMTDNVNLINENLESSDDMNITEGVNTEENSECVRVGDYVQNEDAEDNFTQELNAESQIPPVNNDFNSKIEFEEANTNKTLDTKTVSENQTNLSEEIDNELESDNICEEMAETNPPSGVEQDFDTGAENSNEMDQPESIKVDSDSPSISGVTNESESLDCNSIQEQGVSDLVIENTYTEADPQSSTVSDTAEGTGITIQDVFSQSDTPADIAEAMETEETDGGPKLNPDADKGSNNESKLNMEDSLLEDEVGDNKTGADEEMDEDILLQEDVHEGVKEGKTEPMEEDTADKEAFDKDGKSAKDEVAGEQPMEEDNPEAVEEKSAEVKSEEVTGTSVEQTEKDQISSKENEPAKDVAEKTKETKELGETSTEGDQKEEENSVSGNENKPKENVGPAASPTLDPVTGELTGIKAESEGVSGGQDIAMSENKSSSSESVKVKKESMEKDDSDDIKIINVEPGSKKKLEQKPSLPEDGEMHLQIASVSGATDIPDVLNKENKKVPEAKPTMKSPREIKPDIKQEKKVDPKTPPKSTSKPQTCIVCNKVGKCKYNIVRNGDIKHLCDDVCFQRFRNNPTVYLRNPAASQPQQPTEPKRQPLQQNNVQPEQFKTCSVCQLMNIKTSKPFLNWQGMDFCGEDCLGKFQANLNASCSNCGNMVASNAKGKFCLRFANEVKQFCSNVCYNEFKKRQKLCECCQKDISKSTDAFVAPVGKEGTFKDFCSQVCLQKYEDKTNCDIEIVGVEKAMKSKVLPKGDFKCAVCGNVAAVKHEIKLDSRLHRLCSDPCFSAFQYANKLTMNTCDNCGAACYNDGAPPQYIQFEGQQKRFCSFVCVNHFKSDKKKIVTCAWCSCKKSNFDMIERVDANNKYQLFCSLNCLSLYRVNLQATSNQAVVCDHCRKFTPAQYHLTMSDASVRNFCSYQCVMAFQSQFSSSSKQPPPVTNSIQSQKTMNTRASTRAPPSKQPPASKQLTAKNQQSSQQNTPLISNVVSLAGQGKQQTNARPTTISRPNTNARPTTNTTPVAANQQPTRQTTTTQVQVQQQIVVQPPWPKTLKNKSLMCKPFLQTKATSCRPHTQTKETQTGDDDWEPKKVIIPVPVPFYVPIPMNMYTQPTPVPFPLPVPIPVPCFIPTTKKSADSILKHIKEIQEKIPNDPLEAELLMMAEAVAGGDEESDSDTENEADSVDPVKKVAAKSRTPTPPVGNESTSQTAATEGSSEFGEDMLQMALRMASEMTEPVMDLETSIDPVPVNTEPPPKPRKEEEDDDESDVYVPRETRSGRGSTKRSRGGGGNKRRSKRQKTLPQIETSMDDSITETQEQEPAADANMYLKFTYGVNAWKHWVLQKNSQLEKVSKQGSGKLKMFKTDMMGCTADELNYSLCLFVKEVRKPNGEEYAPDSIFYLCLGIQQYLFENARIDNIFTDMYYEKFTECLNELLVRYEPKVNDSGQLVCRIEEEHLWESKQLGAHSPHVLLNTLVYFNTKYFMLKTAEDHLKLSFTHIMKHWKKCPPGKGNSSGRSVYLRYYCPTAIKASNEQALKQNKKKEELPVYEQAENVDNPLRCPVKLYEFYLSKCPESIKNRSDAFYLVPERSCVPDSPVWYSTQNLSVDAMNKMLSRLRLVREIQEAMIHTQPVYTST